MCPRYGGFSFYNSVNDLKCDHAELIGSLFSGVTVWRDITELKEAEKLEKNYGSYLEYLIMERTAELARARKNAAQVEIELTATIKSASNGIMIFDKDGDLARINSVAEKSLSFTPSEQMLSLEEWLSGLEITTLDGRKREPEEFPALRALKGEFVMNEKLRILARSSPQWRCLSINAAPLCGPNRKLLGAVCTFDDITEQQKNLEASRAAKDDLERKLEQIGAELNEANQASTTLTSDAGANRIVWFGGVVKRFLRHFGSSR